jgi:dihydrofolate synthase/folylpolyglutamate synthase
MTYDEALEFWFGRINYEVRAAGPGDLKLERMTALLGALGDPHEGVRAVHVTGTKGKGSTAAMLDAVLRAAGYRVGLFTSPHLTDVRERVQVNGVPIGREELTARVEELAPAVRAMEAGGPPPTFFEIGTALGFLHFRYRRCEVAVLEVGLGGRFDSTNVCRPLVSVVTNIGLDHTAQLGDTLDAIAYQKAGIIKRGVPVVSGEVEAGPRDVIRGVAAEQAAPLWELGREFRFVPGGRRMSPVASNQRGGDAPRPPTCAEVVTPRRHYPPMPLGLPGEHQVANAAVAVATVERLRDAGLTISDSAVQVGLRHVRWPARVELVADRPAVILDTAHNVPSAEALVRTLRDSFPVAGRRAVVFAVSSDKHYPDILRILATFFDHFHLTRYGNNPRCVPPERLAAAMVEVAPGKAFALHPAAPEAWVVARAAAGPDDLLCVTGSVFLAGELRPLLLPPT